MCWGWGLRRGLAMENGRQDHRARRKEVRRCVFVAEVRMR
jgi:hypothetical protein